MTSIELMIRINKELENKCDMGDITVNGEMYVDCISFGNNEMIEDDGRVFQYMISGGKLYKVFYNEEDMDMIDWDCPDDIEEVDPSSEFMNTWIEDEDFSEADQVAYEIRQLDYWDEDLNERLCELAGLKDEYTEADGDTFESVLKKAAEILDVEI